MKCLISKIDIMSNDEYGQKMLLKKDVGYIVADVYVDVMIRDLGESKIKSAEEFEPAHFYAGEDLNGKKLVVFRNGGIGDLLFISASLKKLKEKYPDASITLITNGYYAKLLKCDASYEMGTFPLLEEKVQEFDYCLYFQSLIESNPSAEHENAYDLFAKACHLDPSVDYKPAVNISTFDLERAKVAKLSAIEFYQQNVEFVPDQDIIHVCIQIAASVTKRSIPLPVYVNLMNALPKNYVFWFFGSENQNGMINDLIQNVPQVAGRIFNGSETMPTLTQMAAFLSIADLVIGPDSSLLHIAGALDTPLIGLYGPFPSALRIATYKNAVGIDSNSNCEFARGEFASCFSHGNGGCELSKKILSGLSPCMELIHSHHILDAMNRLGFTTEYAPVEPKLPEASAEPEVLVTPDVVVETVPV